LAENPGSNRHREAILTSRQSWDIPQKYEKNSIFADFGIQYLSQMIVFESRGKTSTGLYQRSLWGTIFVSIRLFLVRMAIF
jgi:hypothetical protein